MMDNFTKTKVTEEFEESLTVKNTHINEEKSKPFNTKRESMPHILNLR